MNIPAVRYNMYVNSRLFCWDYDEVIVMKFATEYKEAFPEADVQVLVCGRRIF